MSSVKLDSAERTPNQLFEMASVKLSVCAAFKKLCMKDLPLFILKLNSLAREIMIQLKAIQILLPFKEFL